MSDFEPDFDVIVVGGGCAGSIAAYTLASAGKTVLVVERGQYSGAKNMTGGRIYTHSLAQVFPDTWKEAPLQRKVAHERISLMAPDSNFTIDFTSRELEEDKNASYTVLRAPFDQWLAEQAENAGAEYIYGIAVEDLIIEDGKVCGINAFGDELRSHVVILADGVNSLLTSKAGLSKYAPATNEVAVGAKETISLPAEVIESRFLCNPGEGASWLFAGSVSNGVIGGAFIYANEDSISLGIVATMSEVLKQDIPVYQMLENFKNRPEIKPLIRDGKTVEYSGHVVPEGGLKMMPEIIGNGVLVAGDAAMMCMNLGYTVRGMDLAIASGEIAAKAAIQAIDKGDTSKNGLAVYKTMLDNSFIMRDMKLYQDAPAFLEECPRRFNGYPEMIRDIMNQLFITNGEPRQHVLKMAMPAVKKIGMMKLAKDAMKGVKAL